MVCTRKDARRCCDEQKERQRFAKVSVDLARIYAPTGPLVLARSRDMPVDAYSYPNALAAMAVLIITPSNDRRLFVFANWNADRRPNGVWPSARTGADLATVLTGACRWPIPDNEFQGFDKNQVSITVSAGAPAVLRVSGAQGNFTVRWPTLEEIDEAYKQGRSTPPDPANQQRLRRLYDALGIRTATTTNMLELPLLPLQSFDFRILRLTPGIFDGQVIAEKLSEQLKDTGIFVTYISGQVVFKTNVGRLTIVKAAQTLQDIPMLGSHSPPVVSYTLGAPGQPGSQIPPNPTFPLSGREAMVRALEVPREKLINDLVLEASQEQWLVPSELSIPLSELANAL